MKAMVFAAGLGTRLKPFTDSHPKALAEVCGRPMLGLVIERLKKFGVDELVVNIHHFGDQIIDYLHKNDNFGITIHISDERSRLLDTGGGILAAREWLDDGNRFIIHNADILTDFDLAAMYERMITTDGVAMLMVAPRHTSRYLMFEPSSMRMQGWINVDTGLVRPDGLSTDGLNQLAFGGVHVISSSIFEPLAEYARHLEGDRADFDGVARFSIMDFYIDRCRELPIYGYTPQSDYVWHDIGKPASLVSAEKDFDRFYSDICVGEK